MNLMFGRIKQKTNVMPSSFSDENNSRNSQVMSIRTARPSVFSEPTQQTIMPPIIKAPEQATGKQRWGPPVWFFLHTIAHKVKEEKFTNIRPVLLQIIYSICMNLPCPECSAHAQTYLNGINFNNIKTKDELKKTLFVFHNFVNRRTGHPQFDYSELETKYEFAVTRNITANFINHYTDRSGTPKMIANDMFRIRIMRTFKEWFNNNFALFDA